jgi:Kinesin motor domain
MLAFSHTDRRALEKPTGKMTAVLLNEKSTHIFNFFSMMGAEVADGCKMGRETGIIPRFGFSLFERIVRGKLNASIEVSYFEIYNEKIHDLLSDEPGPRQPKPNLRVREHPQFGPYVENLTVQSISSFDSLQVKHWHFLVS